MLPWNAALLLVCLLLPTVAGGNTTQQHFPCIDSYAEFESAVASNGSNISGANLRSQLHDVFYAPNQHLPYSLVVTYQLVLANGTRHILSSDQDCNTELWVWLSSPVFLLADVTYFNRYLLFTLNYFMDWYPPHITITMTTAPCPANMESFLYKMTVSVSLYDCHDYSCMSLTFYWVYTVWTHSQSGLCNNSYRC